MIEVHAIYLLALKRFLELTRLHLTELDDTMRESADATRAFGHALARARASGSPGRPRVRMGGCMRARKRRALGPHKGPR